MYTFAEHPASFRLREVVCHLADMTDRPSYQRTPSTNLAKTPSYRPHEGKFGIVTGGSRGLPRLSELCNLLLTFFRYWSCHITQPRRQRLLSTPRLHIRLVHEAHKRTLPGAKLSTFYPMHTGSSRPLATHPSRTSHHCHSKEQFLTSSDGKVPGRHPDQQCRCCWEQSTE